MRAGDSVSRLDCTVRDRSVVFNVAFEYHPVTPHILQGLPQRYVHLITSAMPPRVTATTNLPCDLRFATPEAYEQLLAGAAGGREGDGAPHSAEEAEEPPVHLFPEGGVTNGRWGMMQFSRGEGCRGGGEGGQVACG